MKFSLIAVPFLAAFAVAAPTVNDASLVARDGGSQIESLLDGLLASVKQYTASMNQTVAALPSNASSADKQTAAASIKQDIAGVTQAFHTTNTQVTAAKQPTLGDLPTAVLGQLNGQPIVLAKLLLPVLQELNPALQSVLVTLSLGELDVALQPLLTVELPTLVTGLGALVNGLLVALSPLLAGLGGILGPLVLGLGL